jgi:hypothetical protein
MNKPVSIVFYGRNERLLETRSWILGNAGYRVSTAMELVEFERILQSGSISLAILCHTLSAEQQREALTIAKGLRPTVKTLLLITPDLPMPGEDADELLSTSEGPGALVASVNRILKTQGGGRPD